MWPWESKDSRAIENEGYRQVAEELVDGKGEAWAQSNLGFMYSQGQGVKKNDAEAVKWFRLAAAQGGH